MLKVNKYYLTFYPLLLFLQIDILPKIYLFDI